MGLFGSTKVYVSSSVKNLAGDPLTRPNYLKSIVSSKVIFDNKKGMGDVLRDAYLHGPGINLRSFYRWSQVPGHLTATGVPQGTLLISRANTGLEAENALKTILGIDLVISSSEVGPPDFMYWVDQWMPENALSEYLAKNWTADYNVLTGQIDIVYADLSMHSFTPVDFVQTAQYLYLPYNQVAADGTLMDPHAYIYKIGSGNATFDAYAAGLNAPAITSGYFPFIPFRLENKFLSSTYESAAFVEGKKAFQKAFKNRKGYTEIIDQIALIPNLADVDHAYAVFGPSVNVVDNGPRRYIYEFFSTVYETMKTGAYTEDTGDTSWANWIGRYNTATTSWDTYGTWQTEQSVPTSPQLGTAPPDVQSLAPFPDNKINIIGSNNLDGNLHFEINWKSISKVTGTGLGKIGALPGDIWFDQTLADSFAPNVTNTVYADPKLVDTHRLYKQLTADTWEAIVFVGLAHRNYIYKKKFVEITLTQALADAEESGFIIPLNYHILKLLPLVEATQLSTACCNVVFNSYEVKKTGLLGSLFFRIIIMVIIAVVVNLALPGAGTTVSASIAGSLGLTGLAAIVVNAAITLVASMVISAIVNPLARAVFGDKLGALIGSIVSFVASVYAGNFINSGSLAVNWGNMMSAANLTKLTSAVGDAYTAYLQADLQGVLAKTADLMEKAQTDLKKLQQAYADDIGYGRGSLDPMMLTQSDRSAFETLESFLTRTLLTGTDIADMSLQMITDFTTLTTSSELPVSFG